MAVCDIWKAISGLEHMFCSFVNAYFVQILWLTRYNVKFKRIQGLRHWLIKNDVLGNVKSSIKCNLLCTIGTCLHSERAHKVRRWKSTLLDQTMFWSWKLIAKLCIQTKMCKIYEHFSAAICTKENFFSNISSSSFMCLST